MGGWGMGGLRVSKARLGGCALHSHHGVRAGGWEQLGPGLHRTSLNRGPWLTGALPGVSSLGK